MSQGAMSAALYDVFVVGPSQPGPTAEARLCTTLATQSGRPVTAIAKALADKNLRVAHGVPREVAERIVRELLALGAATTVTPSGAPARPAPLPPPMPASNGFSLTPLSGARSVPMPAPLGIDGPSTGARLDPPSGLSFGVQPPAPAASAFTVPDSPDNEPVLELATREKAAVPKPVPAETSTSISSLSRPAYTLAGASALNTSKLIATNSASGLSLSDDEADHTIRCPTHGLLFDKRKSKGCRRCVEGRRSAHLGDEPRKLREAPAKRAFLGFGLAFAIGLLPAAYYAKFPGAAEVTRLRAEQADLSQRAGTEANLRRFDEIDDLVSTSNTRNMRNTLFIWVAAGGLVMIGFYRVT
jgi:hypothetical protein